MFDWYIFIIFTFIFNLFIIKRTINFFWFAVFGYAVMCTFFKEHHNIFFGITYRPFSQTQEYDWLTSYIIYVKCPLLMTCFWPFHCFENHPCYKKHVWVYVLWGLGWMQNSYEASFAIFLYLYFDNRHIFIFW